MDDPWLGRRLGNYQLEAVLGRGGMATVYRATHVALGTSHAVKVLAAHFAGHPDVKARFLREGRVQAQFRHPGIATVTDTITGDAVALVMELLVGESLRDVLDRGPISLDAAAIIVDDVAGALAYAHEAGVVHRDIKPDNVFLAEEGGGSLRPVLLDFGVARMLELTTLTQSGIMIGTPGYMSPEQLEDPRSVDLRTDVFSLAVVLFEMINGYTPHAGETPHAIAMSTMMGRIRRSAPAAGAPAALEAVFAKALAPEVRDRYASIEEFADAVHRARSTGSEEAPAPSLESDPERRPERPVHAPTWPPIPEKDVAVLLAERAEGGTIIHCGQCGAGNHRDRTLCRRCGTELT